MTATGAAKAQARPGVDALAVRRERLWPIVHLALGLVEIAFQASRARGGSGLGATEPQVLTMQVLAG